MLTYRCTNECRHCIYRCSPRRPDDWISLETAERAFAALAREPAFDSLHLAGGEATLRFELLLDVVRLARRTGVALSYLETNAQWCTTPAAARAGMEQLREAGLSCVLISASMYHSEFIPFRNTRNCVEAAREVLGAEGAFVYLPHLYRTLGRMPGDGRHTLEEFLEFIGRPGDISAALELFPLHLGGRAVEALRAGFELCPAEDFRGEPCAHELARTTHFHIDLHGNLFTGCAGIAVAGLDDLHPQIGPETHPIASALAGSGPWTLVELARERHGWRSPERGYAGKCDLCLEVRKALFATGAYAELRPAEYYGP